MSLNRSNPFTGGQPEQPKIPANRELIGSHSGPMRIGVLISGRGSNLKALLDAGRASNKWKVAVAISNVVGVKGLARAEEAGVPAVTVPHADFADREAFEKELDAQLRAREVNFVVLAGFMRILSPSFCEKWRDRAINIHPSLLPDFRGLDTHRRALEAGRRRHGCTVHFVRAELDAGPIFLQAAVPVYPDDTEEVLAARVLKKEHSILPQAVDSITEGWPCVENKQVLDDDLWTRNRAKVTVAKNCSATWDIFSRRAPRSSAATVNGVNSTARLLLERAMAWMLFVRRRAVRHRGGGLQH